MAVRYELRQQPGAGASSQLRFSAKNSHNTRLAACKDTSEQTRNAACSRWSILPFATVPKRSIVHVVLVVSYPCGELSEALSRSMASHKTSHPRLIWPLHAGSSRRPWPRTIRRCTWIPAMRRCREASTALIGNCYVCSSLEQPPHRGQVICHLCPPPEQTRCDAQAEDRRSVFVDVIDVLRARQALEPGVDSL